MKLIILIMLLSSALLLAGQEKRDSIIIHDSWQKQDSTKTGKVLTDSLAEGQEMKIIKRTPASSSRTEMEGTPAKSSIIELNILKSYKKSDNPIQEEKKKRFDGHWCGFYYGFTNFAHSDYSVYPAGTNEFMELNWAQSFTMQLNIFEKSFNLVPRKNFGLVTGIGMEYKRLLFENNHISITKNDNGMIQPFALETLGITDVKRNSFKILYLTIPLLLEYQFPRSSGNKFYISGGVMGGIRLHSKTKAVYYNEDGEKRKTKNSNSFSMIPFKADVIGQIGYKRINIWATYGLTNIFKNGKGPGLHQYTIGLGLNF